ncbi:MAG TPA: N-(5'-phosphoribosyl)anthranilate isomerase, partial [Xanthomonadales bacterium]|nr:N-(5'-phosphoribosyl)anthranilate isomerase [Xanthomonadales bacterium]
RPGSLPLILAGGLNAENVASAIAAVKPWAVDVSSGVETEPGIKSGREIERFIKEAKSEYGS